jgi:membrane protein required for colicin V production
MNWLDFCLIGIVAISVAEGFAKGFIRLGIGFIATVFAFLMAAWFYGMAASWLSPAIHSPLLAKVVGFGLVFGAVIIVGAIISALMSRAFRLIGLGLADRAGGAVLGAVRGVLLCVILIVGMLAFIKDPPQAMVESHFTPYLAGTAQTIANLTPYEIRSSVRQQYEDLKRIWGDVIKKPRKKLATQEI